MTSTWSRRNPGPRNKTRTVTCRRSKAASPNTRIVRRCLVLQHRLSGCISRDSSSQHQCQSLGCHYELTHYLPIFSFQLCEKTQLPRQIVDIVLFSSLPAMRSRRPLITSGPHVMTPTARQAQRTAPGTSPQIRLPIQLFAVSTE